MRTLLRVMSVMASCGISSSAFCAEPNFAGLGIGVGLSFTHDLGWNDRVTKASVVNGIVRVDEQRNDLARIVFEAHYFFQPGGPMFGLEKEEWGHGPFVAVAPTTGSDKLIDGIGLGWMIGFRHCPKKAGAMHGDKKLEYRRRIHG